MTRRKRRVLIWLSSAFGIIAIATATGIFFFTLDQNKAKKYISAGVSKATGRQLSINGDLKLDLGWISRLSAGQIQFENAEWSKHPQMVEVGFFDVQIDLWQLLSKFRVVLPTVTISQPKVILEKMLRALQTGILARLPLRPSPFPSSEPNFPSSKNSSSRTAHFYLTIRKLTASLN